MNKAQIIARNAGRVIIRNSPVILTAVAVGGVLTTAFLASKATLKSAGTLEQMVNGDGLTKIEAFKLVWKNYIPAASAGAATILCVVGSTTISTRRTAALLSAVTLSESAYREYREQTVQEVGVNKEQKIRDNVAAAQVAKATGSEVIVLDDNNVLCYDQMSGRFFKGTQEGIRAAVNDINEMILNGENYASVNQFHALLGLPGTVMGESLGWSIENLLDVHYSTVLKEGVPCLALEYRSAPREDYFRSR